MVSSLSFRRLGRQIAGRNRPLLIRARCASDAKTLLRTSIRNSTGNISFRADLTPAQQNHLKILRSELEAMKENGITDKTIKYINGIPKIISISNFRSPKENTTKAQ